MDDVDEVDFQWRVTTTCEQQVLLVKSAYKRVVAEVHLNVERTVAIVNDALCHVPWSNVIIFAHPLGVPPAVGDADLILRRIGHRIFHIECLGLQTVPDVLWEGGNTLIVTVVAVESKAIDSVPVDCRRAVACPDDGLYLLITTRTVNPDVLFSIDLQWCIATTGEQQVLFVERADKRIVAEVHLNVERTVAIVNDALSHVPWSNVIIFAHPLGIPPAVGDTNLVLGRIRS